MGTIFRAAAATPTLSMVHTSRKARAELCGLPASAQTLACCPFCGADGSHFKAQAVPHLPGFPRKSWGSPLWSIPSGHKRKHRMKQSCPPSYSARTLTENIHLCRLLLTPLGTLWHPSWPSLLSAYLLILQFSPQMHLPQGSFSRFPRLTQFPRLAHNVICNYALGW